MTADALRQALAALPAQTEVWVYADWEGEGERLFGVLEERLYVCGCFAVRGVEFSCDAPMERGGEPAVGRAVLRLGEEMR